MTSLSKWDPAHDIGSMRRMMDRFVNDPMYAGANHPYAGSRSKDGGHNIAVDVIEREGAYIINASMPGVKPEDLEIMLVDNVLTINGERKHEHPACDESYHLRERAQGNFSRRIVFPATVDTSRVEAFYEYGVLTIVLPKCSQCVPTRVDVKSTLNHQGGTHHPRVLTQPSAASQVGPNKALHS